MESRARPRALALGSSTARTRLEPPRPDEIDLEALPAPLLARTGRIHSGSLPQQGRCHLVLRINAEHGTFLLKVARGRCRGVELRLEHTAMRELAGSPVPVPRSHVLAEAGDLTYQLREWTPGVPLSLVLKGGGSRTEPLRHMAAVLAAIHGVTRTGWTWAEWMEASLGMAAENLAAGVIDPADFEGTGAPEEVYQWLQKHRPVPGQLSLLHGDFRPKNLLWHQGRVTAVIDWAFADWGDPYYDLAIALYYAADDRERQAFLEAYELVKLDEERLRYFERLSWFLNV